MPRANRYMLPGYVYHLTHRCHDRGFLLRNAKDRDGYREWLREGIHRYKVMVFGYAITRNHVHVLVEANDPSAVGKLMHLAAGSVVRPFNHRRDRSGAFWEDQYQATIVQTDSHLLNCLCYIDLNMPRTGAVAHPEDWKWCGYHELVGVRRRYRLVDLERLLEVLGGLDVATFQRRYAQLITNRLAEGCRSREPHWTESLAVGSREFVDSVQGQYRFRQQFLVAPITATDGLVSWAVRETPEAYRHLSRRKNVSKA